jgi:tRNA pseudouridine38-40 synthase
VVPERRYRALVEYDGTDFLGYQIQARGRTVQGEIEKALKKVAQANIRIDAAGRTDTGVHAVGQVIAFNATWRHPLTDFQRALNATVPQDIVISDLRETAVSFHPRYGALSRHYRYTIINQPWPSVLQRRYAYHVKKKLDVEAMREASRCLIGSHDFASFGKPTQGESTIRTLMQADWSQQDRLIIFDITANAFLYRMVRRIVGTLVQVGLGELAAGQVKTILERRELTQSAPPAPAHGLCLVKVTYPENA